MRTEQCQFKLDSGWGVKQPGSLAKAQLVLVFASRTLLEEKGKTLLEQISCSYPQASIVGCSTSGEIQGIEVSDETLTVCAMQFEHTSVRSLVEEVQCAADSRATGKKAATSIPHDGLKHVLVLSEGLSINGSELVQGLTESLPKGVTVTGGLAGDAGRFEKTLIIDGKQTRQNAVAIVGFYGDKFRVSYASLGGWDTFGGERVVTRSQGNVLYELDGTPVLELYKTYLGEHYAGLPATGLLFPLSIRSEGSENGVVRTILGVDHENGSITFAGDIPQGAYAKLMKANFDRLVDGAIGAAEATQIGLQKMSAEVALLISCVGRKMVLKQRTEEEVEGVRDVLGPNTVLTGFYSYGEISPFTPNARCELHNQTMTITAFGEN